MPPATLLPLSEIPTLTLLYKLRHLQPFSASSSSSYSASKPNPRFNDLVSLLRHDITSLRVSAIVNAANRSLMGGGGVDGAIHARAGPRLVWECETLGGCETGSAKITDAYDLPCEKVIHAVGPVYWVARREREGLEKELLKGCYRTSLQLAVENKCKSIAFSCLSAGVYGYPSRDAAEVALETVREWVVEQEKADFGGLERIVFCCFEKKDEVAYQELIPKFFPPVEEQTPSTDEAESSSRLARSMPDPPATEPREAGEPDSKKQKLASSPAADEEWESVERPDGSAENGIRHDPEITEHLAESEIVDGERKEDVTAALHTAEMGGNPPKNMLEKDW